MARVCAPDQTLVYHATPVDFAPPFQPTKAALQPAQSGIDSTTGLVGDGNPQSQLANVVESAVCLSALLWQRGVAACDLFAGGFSPNGLAADTDHAMSDTVADAMGDVFRQASY